MTVYKDDANLQGLWLLNNDWADYTPNANTLTPVNSPTFNSGDKKEGTYSADFESSSSQYAGITDAAQSGLDITSNISFGGWVKPESLSSDIAISGKYNGGGNRGYTLIVQSTGAIICYLSSDGSALTYAQTLSSVISTGTWYHIVVVYNSTDIRIYVDGAVATRAGYNPKTYSGGIYNNSAPFQIGAYNSGTYFDGLLDEIFVFDRELSSAEVSDIYTNGIQDPVSGIVIPVAIHHLRQQGIS